MIKHIDPLEPDIITIRKAVRFLQAGELIIIPTETVYGIACDPRVKNAQAKVYKAKGRPDSKPIARFVRSSDQFFFPGTKANPLARALAEEFMPGPLTLVLPFLGDWVGFRIPDHPVPLAILETLDAPLAVTSANVSGAPDPQTAEEAVAAVGKAAAMTLDAGPCKGGTVSTVIRVDGDRIEILRKGALAQADIFATARAAGFEQHE